MHARVDIQYAIWDIVGMRICGLTALRKTWKLQQWRPALDGSFRRFPHSHTVPGYPNPQEFIIRTPEGSSDGAPWREYARFGRLASGVPPSPFQLGRWHHGCSLIRRSTLGRCTFRLHDIVVRLSRLNRRIGVCCSSHWRCVEQCAGRSRRGGAVDVIPSHSSRRAGNPESTECGSAVPTMHWPPGNDALTTR